MASVEDLQARLAAALAGRYTIEREIGRGGMSIVYLARDLRNERRVALKVLRPDLAQALGPDRFLREIKVAATLAHPHILPLFDSGAAGGCSTTSRRTWTGRPCGTVSGERADRRSRSR